MAESDGERIDPKVRDVLILLAAGTFLAGSLVFPGLPLAAKPFLKHIRENDVREWKKFNRWRLKALLKRLRAEKVVEFVKGGDDFAVKITEKGKKKVLSYRLDDLKLVQKWDGKWRIVIYDIPDSSKRERDLFRILLKKMKFFPLQKSVYLTPYPCEDEIEYLRQTFGLGDCITVLKTAKIENDIAYREYFGLKKTSQISRRLKLVRQDNPAGT